MKIFSTLTRRLAVLTTVLIIVSAVLILMNGCGPSDRERQLLDLETSLEENPDSVLEILDQNPKLAQGEKEQHLYNLLHAFARYKIAQQDTTPQVIESLNKAAKYYDIQTDFDHSAIAYYLLGKSYYYKNDPFHSIVSMLKGADRAGNVKNHFWLAMNYRGLAESFETLNDWGSVLLYLQKSKNIYDSLGKDQYSHYALVDLSRCYFALDSIDKAYELSQKAYEISISTGNDDLRSGALSMMGTTEFHKKNYSQSNKILENLMREFPFYKSSLNYEMLGMGYLSTGNLDKAKTYLDSINMMDGDYGSLYWQYENAIGDKETAIKALSELLLSQNKFISEIWDRRYSSLIIDYYDKERETAENKLRYEKKSKLYLILLSASILSLSVCILIMRILFIKNQHRKTISKLEYLSEIHKQFKRSFYKLSTETTILASERDKLTKINNSLSQQLHDQQKRLEQLSPKTHHLISKNLSIFQKCCEDLYTFKSDDKVKNNWHKYIMELISSLQNDQSFQQELEDEVNKSLDELMLKFRKDLPNLKDPDYSLFLYHIFSFSSNVMSVLLNVEVKTIYNRKASLKKKIIASNSIHQEIFLEVLL